MEKSITISLNTTYHVLGELSEKTEQVWFLLHGYGQLASFFIKKFDFLDLQKNYLIAPQGFNKFYLEGFSGRVGANWMTKEDRLNEIANYTNYLNQVYYNELKNIDNQNIKINVLAFSQGCATASRWIAYGHFKPHQLILWAGEIPQDVVDSEVFKSLPLTIFWGEQDELIKSDMIAIFANRLREAGLFPRIVKFDGKHEVDIEVFKRTIL
ncbi:MAG: serine hydrolase family protein [Thermoflexibacter sp.]|nr:serine hydrolase family protein [Thermoflexibacter sp.]